MQRINPVENSKGRAKELLDRVRQNLGSTPNIFTALANSPVALESYLDFNERVLCFWFR